MKTRWMILGIVIGVVATAFVNSSSEQHEPEPAPALAKKTTLSPWQIRRVDVNEPMFFNQFDYLVLKYRMGLKSGWYRVYAWIEETSGEDPSPNIIKKVIDYGVTRTTFTNPEILFVLPTEKFPQNTAMQFGGCSTRGKINIVFTPSSSALTVTTMPTIGETYEISEGEPFVLFREMYGSFEENGPPRKGYRLLLQIDSIPDPNKGKSK